MKICFVANASKEMGSGHIFRCMTLANKMSTKTDTDIYFYSNVNDLEHLNKIVQAQGFQILKSDDDLKKLNIDRLIIDSYDIDQNWELSIKSHVKKIIVIDDLANRKHSCDLLVDQNYYVNMNQRYKHLTNEDCKLLIGPHFAILRDEFLENRSQNKKHSGSVNKIMVNFGGTDPHNLTLEVLNEFNNTDHSLEVIIGQSNKQLDSIKAICENNNFNLHIQTQQIAKIMSSCDLAIASNGTSTWERCCLGLPTISIAIADNQISLSKDLSDKGGCFYMGQHTDENIIKKTMQQFKTCLEDPNSLIEQSNLIKEMVNGKGAEYVCDYVLKEL